MPKALSGDHINRFRITHPDRELRPLLRRVHQLPQLLASINGDNEDTEHVSLDAVERKEGDRVEVELTRIELYKWKATIERILASARNLDRQAEKYRSKAELTERQTKELQQTLVEEKAHLRARLAERERQKQCDEVYERIMARPKQKAELEEQIAQLKSQIASHATTHARYVAVAQQRAQLLATIGPIVEQVRAMRLPVETKVTEEEDAIVVDTPEAAPAVEIDDPSSSSSRTQLSAAAAPFQPGTASSSTAPSAPSAPSGSRKPNGRSTASPQPGSSAAVLPPNQRASSYALPRRPDNSGSSSASAGGAVPSHPKNGTRALSADAAVGARGIGGLTSTSSGSGSGSGGKSVPARAKSGLRNSATPGREEGEVDGQEEGEVDDKEKEKGRRSRGGRHGRR